MSRVHCIDCDLAVVVDPSGICPDGHLVGPGGGRVESAIGSPEPHPDEPEPWVVRVEIDAAEPESEPSTRVARPVTAPGIDAAADGAGDDADTEDLLQELHALADPGDDGLAGFGALEAAVNALEHKGSDPENLPAPEPAPGPSSAPAAASTDASPSAPTSAPAPVPVRRSADDTAVDALTELANLFDTAPAALSGDARPSAADAAAPAAPPAPPIGSRTTTAPPAPSPLATTRPPAPATPAGPAAPAAHHAVPPAPPRMPAPRALPTEPPARIDGVPAAGQRPDAEPDEPRYEEAEPRYEEAEPLPASNGSSGGSLDIGNFTARGTKVGTGTRRRRFGR